MGGSGSGVGLELVGLPGLLSGSQLQTDGAVPCTALLLLPSWKVHQSWANWAWVSIIALHVHFFTFYVTLLLLVAMLPWSKQARSHNPSLRSFCLEFACSSRLCVWILHYPSTTQKHDFLHKFPLDTSAWFICPVWTGDQPTVFPASHPITTGAPALPPTSFNN